VGLVLKLLLIVTSGFFFILVVAVSLSAFLILTGKPKACVDRAVNPAPPPSQELQANWQQMRAQVAAGQTISLAVTELQATSRGVEYLDESDVPVDDFVIHFCPDHSAEAQGRIDVLGLGSNVLVKGRLDVSGEKPRVKLDSFKAGNFPSFIAKRAVQLLLDEKDVRTLDLFDNIEDVEYRDGEVVVTVAP